MKPLVCNATPVKPLLQMGRNNAPVAIFCHFGSYRFVLSGCFFHKPWTSSRPCQHQDYFIATVWVLKFTTNSVSSIVGVTVAIIVVIGPVGRKTCNNAPPVKPTFVDQFSSCAKRYHATKNSCSLAPQAHRSLSMRAETCSCKTTAAISHRPMDYCTQKCWGHTWIAIQVQEDMDLSHDQQTSSCNKKLLCSHAAGTLGSHSVRNETSSCDKTAAFSRRKHTWISLQRHVPAKRLWRSRAAPNIDDF